MNEYPIRFEEIVAARERIRPFLPATPLRSYALLDETVGSGVSVFVKHENHNPTNAFKVRNALSALTSLPPEELSRGSVAASTGNHGVGLAWAGKRLGSPVTICVPTGNNPDKNAAIRGLGATLIEEGKDYDEAILVAARIARERGLRTIHSTNDPMVIAGAGTIALEMLEERPDLEALVVAVGGGSQAIGALVVRTALAPGLEVYGVQAAGARVIHDSWHAGRPLEGYKANTFAEGVATRSVYELTFPGLLGGLSGFVTVEERDLAAAVRILLTTTHNLVEGAGAAGLAGLLKLKETLQGKRCGLILTGANVDLKTLGRILAGDVG